VGEDVVHKMGMISQALRSAREREIVPRLRDPESVPA
jgi:hypothetical protein